MYLLLTVLVSTLYVAVCSGIYHGEQYLLPTDIRPNLYDVRLFLDPNKNNFTGEVSIDITAMTDSAHEIVMHAKGMNIAANGIKVNSKTRPTPENLAENFTLATDDTNFLRIALKRPLEVQEIVIIHIKYTSLFSRDMYGVFVRSYISEKMPQYLLTTQFQPTYARSAFPCFDEPRWKAGFRTTIYAPRSYNVVLSNMPLRNDLRQVHVPGWIKHEFQDTPIMSTYLQGYLVSNLDYLGNMNSPIVQLIRYPYKVYSRPNTQDSAVFAQNVGQTSFSWLESMFNSVRYPPRKLDNIAVPDFATEASGNWGLCFYRETSLLVKDNITTTATRYNVVRTISRETTQFWFSNAVTPVSWRYLWLSEGLATFYSVYLTDLIEFASRVYQLFALEVQNVMQSDAVLSVKPVSHPVYTPTDILSNYNAITSVKAAAVLHMLQNLITPEVLLYGVGIYVEARSGKTAEPVDLYDSIQNATQYLNQTLQYPVQRIMDSWVTQPGFPVLMMNRIGNSVTINQVRYLLNGATNETGQWYIPIISATASNSNFATRQVQWITPGGSLSFNFPQFSAGDWFIINKQAGYFRVNYDVENWASLTRQLLDNNSVIDVVNRASLLDDAFNLARSGHLHYNYTLNLSQYLKYEEEYIPFGAVNPSFTYLDVVLSGTSAHPLFKHYILNITETLYHQLGFNASNTEMLLIHRPYLRNVILDLNCRQGNEHCVNTSETLMRNLQANPDESLNPDIQMMVYCTSLRGGSSDSFMFLWNMYLASTDFSKQSILLNALGCTTNVFWRNFYLNQAFEPNPNVKDQDGLTVIMSVINSSPENINAALEFVVQHFNVLQERIQSQNGVTNILHALAGKLTTQAHANRVDELVRRHHSIFTAADWDAIGAIRENIQASIVWRARHAATVEAWLQDNYGSNAIALTSSLILLISLLAIIFNQ